MAKLKIEPLLARMAEIGGRELHLRSNLPPMADLQSFQPLDDDLPAVSGEDLQELIAKSLTPAQLKAFKRREKVKCEFLSVDHGYFEVRVEQPNAVPSMSFYSRLQPREGAMEAG